MSPKTKDMQEMGELGYSDTPSPVTPEMRRIMQANSKALSDALTKRESDSNSPGPQRDSGF